MNLSPLDDRLVIALDDPVSTTAGGLHLPPVAQERPQWGRVLAVGPGRRSAATGARQPMPVAPGDTVLVPAMGGSIYNPGDGTGELLLLLATDVLAVADGPEDFDL